MKNHSLFTTLWDLRGNPRGCVYTEPLWGIPYNLYAPYVSIYMIAIGLSEQEIGLILSISVGFQVILALFSGVITDKLGRRLTTLIFDLLSWTVPAIISAVAQNFWYFLAAGVINSVWRITHNSWTCLLVEDAREDQLVDIFTWIQIANLFVGFVAPLAGLLIGIYSLVPTVRGLYVFAAIMFTTKAVLTYIYTDETAQGKIRMQQTKDQSVFSVFGEYRGVLRDLLRAPHTLYTSGIMVIIAVTALIANNFWAIIVTQKLNIPEQNLAYFPFIRSAIILIFFFLIMPRINRLHFKLPLVVGFIGFVASQVLLITTPEGGYALLILSTILEACSYAVCYPLVDKLTVLTINAQERARIQSILSVGIILVTVPFGWIAGTLSAMDKDLPFILNIVLFAIGAILAYIAGQVAERKPVVEATAA
jgi:DHA1 family tetracycline resistance protein-like MFS transporter